MKSLGLIAAVALIAGVRLTAARLPNAEAYSITLELVRGTPGQSAGAASVVAHSSDSPRPLVTAHPGESLTVRLSVTRNVEPTVEDVLVHFYVVPEAALGDERIPDLKPERVLVEGAETVDFKTKDKAQASFTFRVRKLGAYLVRVEAIDPGGATLSNSFAALDLEVK